ncbi:MAG: hypothetical protein RJQ07_01600 [Pseudomonadales bacterium]
MPQAAEFHTLLINLDLNLAQKSDLFWFGVGFGSQALHSLFYSMFASIHHWFSAD